MNPLVVLQARAEARAYLWRICEFGYDEARSVLFRDAIARGLADDYGADVVAAIIDAAFES